MNAEAFWAGLVLIAVLLSVAYDVGGAVEIKRIEQKCRVEMQDKPFKEAIEFCKERVK